MKRIKYYLAIITVFTALTGLNAQSDIDLNHRWLSLLDSNPATINTEYLEFSGMTRNQWVGFPGAPVSQLFSVSGYSKNINSGFGLTILNDRIGYTGRVNAKGMYSYNIQFDDNRFKHISMQSMLSFGLAIGLSHYSTDPSKITTNDDIVDPNVLNRSQSEGLKPDFDFGINFIHGFSGVGLIRIGASATHINNMFASDGPDKISCNYHAYASFEPSSDLSYFSKLKPVFGMSYMQYSNIANFELIGMLLFKAGNRQLWIGESLKFRGNSLSTFLGVEIFKNLNLGYAFEYTYSSVGKSSRSSHELMLTYTFSLSDEANCAAYRTQGNNRRSRGDSYSNKFLMF
jgi:type IX secretion system PorP/SprF family membrane protein